MEDEKITYKMKCARIEHLLNDLEMIADLGRQYKVWVEESIPGVVDSWEERMCLIDDIDIRELIGNGYLEFGFSFAQISKLTEFINIIDKYSDSTSQYMDPRDVIADPEWHKVVECAKETLKAFEGYEVPKET